MQRAVIVLIALTLDYFFHSVQNSPVSILMQCVRSQCAQGLNQKKARSLFFYGIERAARCE
jgi:hypothetical protein